MEDDRLEQDDSPGTKTMLKGLVILIVLLGVGGGGSYIYSKFTRYQEKEAAATKAIVKAVSESESVMPGTKTSDALGLVLVASGKYTKTVGWSCNKNVKDGSYDVWLDLTVNDKPEKLHWVVDAENILHPANDLAQKITIRQRLSL